MLKQRLNRCVLLRLCALLSVLSVCAHVYVYVKFKGYDLMGWKRDSLVTLKPLQPDIKHQKVSKAVSRLSLRDLRPTCCPLVQQHRKVSLQHVLAILHHFCFFMNVYHKCGKSNTNTGMTVFTN